MSWREERGSAASIFLVVCWALILFGLVVAADFGRIYFYREQMQTAVDAAALAGASHVERWVTVSVPRQRWDGTIEKNCRDEFGFRMCDLGDWVPMEDGTETGLYPLEGWFGRLCNGVDCDESQVRWSCELRPKGGNWENVNLVAQAVFQRNAATMQWAPYVQGPFIARNGSPQPNWTWFSVDVEATAQVPTMLWSLMGGKSSVSIRRSEQRPITASARPILRATGGHPNEPPAVCQ